MTTLFCPAKVNLFLAIHGKDASGYHEIETVLARVPTLADELTITPAHTLTVSFDPAYDIDPENNSITKAVHLLEEKAKRALPYRITVRKNIPPQSGLGGGASNAATTLLALNQLENLQLSREELMQLGAQIGMDVPFFVSGHEVALATHYGERIHPLQKLPENFHIQIELNTTQKMVSTPMAYAQWDEAPRRPAPPAKPFLAHLQNGYVPGLLATLYNDFEQLFPPEDPTVHLCGSGGATFSVALPSHE